ncbi:Transmembrane protein 18 [Actinomortierella wolfii]|nr:Transmembrane protein 18 [Actinomortierella wolfii]
MPNSSEPTSQFWADFWATIYHFTHPFSSTFFDQLFETQQEVSGESKAPDAPSSTNLAAAHTVTSLSQPTPSQSSSNAKYFASQEAFQKYWKNLQEGHAVDGSPESAHGQLQASWVELKSMARNFIEAVNWQQWWIQAILAMHVFLFVTIILMRNSPNALSGLLMITIVFAALSEPFNRLGQARWKEFADDNYFDNHGVFTTIIWSMPLLLNGLLAVVFLVRKTIQLLVKVKRAQVASEAKKKRKKNK